MTACSYPIPIRVGAAALLGLLVAAWVAGCGGGVGSGGTGSFASGPITGFGSIVVNGVHFDDSAASVRDDDDLPLERGRLRLGMTVDVEGGPVTAATASDPARASATHVQVRSVLLGPVDTVDAQAQTLVVAGHTVVADSATVLDDRLPAGLAGLQPGSVVEVHGDHDAARGRFLASRIEPRDAATRYKVRGLVTALDGAARTLAIDSQTYLLAGGIALPTGLALGDPVRLQTDTAKDGLGRWVVTGVDRRSPPSQDRDEIKLRGLVTAFVSSASFVVNGVSIDASAARVEGGTVAPGARVEVEGFMRGSSMVAREVKLETEIEAGSRFELTGTVAGVDVVARSFTVAGRSEVVSYADAGVSFEGGSAVELVAGRTVEVRGRLTPDRMRVLATRIKFR